MTPERWRRIANLYRSAMERRREDRAAFLASACQNDSDIRHDVEELLRKGDPNVDREVCDASDLDEDTHTVFAPGARLGSFQIEAPLGSGGMGEVFRARDTRLGRTVAIKILKRVFSAPFQREARAIAALNHPNICTLHEAGPNYPGFWKAPHIK
jgi:serine/threonine protein kinase